MVRSAVSIISLAWLFVLVACNAPPINTNQAEPEEPSTDEADTMLELEMRAEEVMAAFEDAQMVEEQASAEDNILPEDERPRRTPFPTSTPAPTPRPVPQEIRIIAPEIDAEELSMISRLNAWRVQEGLWPLRHSDRLQQMAEQQVAFLGEGLGIGQIPAVENFHRGPQGGLPMERALAFGWDYYNNPGQVAVDEIKFLGFNENAAVDFWINSAIHNRIVTGEAFREIGAAVASSPSGNVYIVTFGGEPNVLPALIDPSNDVLHLSSERYRFAPGDRIQEPTEVRISPDGESGEFQPWSLTVPLPDYGAAGIFVTYTDGDREITMELDPALDAVWLDGPTP